MTLELLELARIPDTTSVLGSYEALLDGNGDLLEAKRVRRYSRNQTDAQQGGGNNERSRAAQPGEQSDGRSIRAAHGSRTSSSGCWTRAS